MHHAPKRSDFSRLPYRLESGTKQRRDDLDAGNFLAMAWHYVEQAGVPNITGVWRGKWPENDACTDSQISSRSRPTSRHGTVGCHLGNYAAKHVIVVDDDIDIHDWEAIEWALCYRVNAGLGTSRSWPERAARCSIQCALEDRNSVKYGHGSWTRVLIDATINWQLEPQNSNGGQRTGDRYGDIEEMAES